MNYMGLYLFIGVCVVFTVVFLVKNSKPAVAHSVVSNDKEDEVTQMTQQSSPNANVNNNTLVNDDELIAVISAAIAASMGSQSNIVVRSIRRVYDPTPVWAKTGRTDVMSSRF